ARARHAAPHAQAAEAEDRARDLLPGRRQRGRPGGGAAGVSAVSEAVKAWPSAGVKTLAVVGGGIMGNGIAQTFATGGFEVHLIEARQEFIDRALNTVGRNLERVAKKLAWAPGQSGEILERIRG